MPPRSEHQELDERARLDARKLSAIADLRHGGISSPEKGTPGKPPEVRDEPIALAAGSPFGRHGPA
jgi:hypothetical protein